MDKQLLCDKNLIFLLKNCSEGDKVSLEELYIKVAPILNCYALKIVRSIEMSNEVLQDIIQIWIKAATYNPERGKPMSWMFAIVRNRAFDKVRMEKKHFVNCNKESETLLAEYALDVEFNPETELSRAQTMDYINRYIDNLPPSHRISIYLTYVYGYSLVELSEILDTNINTIKSWLRRGIRSLKLLEEDANIISSP